MPKSNSQPQTIVSARHRKHPAKLSWLHQRTKDALEYYAKTKKQDLKSAKIKYLQKIGETQQPTIPATRRPSQNEEEATPRLRRLTLMRDRIYKEEPDSQPADNYMADAAEEAEALSLQSSLSSEAHYELKGVHLAALEVQRIIDGCLDFHFCSRKHRSLSRAVLVDYLKTTRYSLNCERYLHILNTYNPRAYRWEDDRIACRQYSGKEIEQRLEETRERMRRKRVEELQLLL